MFILGFNTHSLAMSCSVALGGKSTLSRALNGEKVYDSSLEVGSLDTTTIANLELEELLLKPFMDMAPTTIGANRIKHLLTHPHLNPDDIKRRLEAISELENNMELVSQVYDLMKEVKETDSSCLLDLERNLNGSTDHEGLGNGFIMQTISTSFCGLGLVTGFLFGDFSALPQFLGLGAVMTYSAMKRWPKYDSTRRVIDKGKSLSNLLGKVQSAELIKIQKVLSSLNEKEDPFGIKEVSNALKRLAPKPTVDVLQVVLQSRVLVRYFGYKKLQEWKTNLALYLSAWAELEAYITIIKFNEQKRSSMALADVIDSAEPMINIEEGHHPYYFFADDENSVSNSVELSARGVKSKVLTGPNAAGKTTFLRMISINILLAQSGFPVPVKSMSITPLQVATNFAVLDSSKKNESTFKAQSIRLAEIYQLIENGKHTFVALDEILTGTSQEDHRDAESANFVELHETPNVISILATHDREMARYADELAGVSNLQVSLEGNLILEGASTIYNASDVMREAGVPERVLIRMEQAKEARN